MRPADDILIDRAVQDFEDGLAHARQRIRDTHGRLAGSALDALLMGAITALHVRARMRDDVRQLIDIARRVHKGEDPHALAEAHLDQVLRLKQKMHLIAREDDPDFQHVKALALQLFARRLPDLARMTAVGQAQDYDELVRKAFPDRAHVDRLVDDNAAAVRAIVDHLEAHPHVLHMPRSFAPKMAAMAREFIEWKVQDVRKGIDIIYGDAAR